MFYRLRRRSTDLADALAVAGWEKKLDAQEVYLDLHDAGVLLGRLGWRRELPDELMLDDPTRARFAVQALTDLLAEEADNASLARRSGEHGRALEVEQSWRETHTTLWRLEAALAGVPAMSEISSSSEAGT